MDANVKPERYEVVIIGGGQAGLSLARLMAQAGIDYVVLERAERFHAWKQQRWDSFCLVTPNWQCRLPGYAYAGDDPHGFMVKQEIIAFVEGFCASFAPNIREGVEVTALLPAREGYEIRTSTGVLRAAHVCIATGGYHTPITPRMAERLPARLMQVHANEYRNPAQLPDGAVLVVGTGQSGCQVAEDLHLAGRRVHLAVGSAPRVSRFYRGRDIVDWLQDMGHYDLPVSDHPMQESVRGKANHYVTGRDGGRDIDLRKFAAEGMALHGHLAGIAAETLNFADDLAQNLDQADRVNDRIKDSIDAFIANQAIAAPTEPRSVPLWRPGPEDPPLDMAREGINSIVWCVGYRPDYAWVHVPVFTGTGAPAHQRGITAAPGLYFLGLPWLHTWGSGRFAAIARDAEHLAQHIKSTNSASAILYADSETNT
ncbi:MAG: FAD-dependent oxidoreductase [Rhodospirillales bacterium 20-64-7]|nr:MAG: FAD-dependent oxidoreductase [Rhodospirillales bacterium 20-64-7]